MNSAQNSGKTARRGRPFKPGQSGNPGGRPKTAKFAEAVRDFLNEKRGGKTRLEQVLDHLLKHDPKILLYYAYGKPADSVELHETHSREDRTALAVAIAQEWARIDSAPKPAPVTPLIPSGNSPQSITCKTAA